MNSPVSHAASNTMTKKTKQNKQKGSTNPSAGNREIARLTKLVENTLINERKIRLSPVGKLAFDGGNAVSSFFGLGKIFGSGAYKMRGGNSSWDTTNQVPIMHSGQDSIRICHREYIGPVKSSVAFEIQNRYDVNPGLPSCFPYLSAIANSFQEYKFKGLVYEFKSLSADALNSTNTALGSIMMVAQYRADAPAPTNKIQVLNEMWSASSKPASNCFLPIECDPKESPLGVQYIRSSSLAATQDAKFYDLASVYIATQGSQASAEIGELWVTYDVELYKPVMAATSGPFAANAYSWAGSLATTALPMGVQVSSQSYGLAITVSASLGRIVFPSGSRGRRFLVNYGWDAATSVAFLNETFSDCSQVVAYQWAAGAPTVAGDAGGTTTAQYVRTQILEITGDAPANYSLTVTIVGAATCDVKVVQIPDEYI